VTAHTAAPISRPAGRVAVMFKAFCILVVIFIGVGLVGISIRRRRGR
jgi:hypothetical protein